MPYYKAPRGDLKRLAFLQRAAQTGNDDLLSGLNYLSEATVDTLNDQSNSFASAYQMIAARLGERMAVVDECEVRLKYLQTRLRDLWEMLRRRSRRDGEPVNVLGYYQLPGDGNKPKPGNRDAWISLAEAVIAGEAEAISAGFPPADLPTIAQVQVALTALRQSTADLQMADRALDLAQANIAALRPAADAAIAQVMDELRYNLRDMEPSSQRRVARTYGAEYSYRPDEVEDPVEDPLPPAGESLPEGEPLPAATA
ncbi:MAG: hypothetical protein JW862_18730 [Anaerolineales bacterium]|nr:hypothetical protein [Anaerolineales bacterium]